MTEAFTHYLLLLSLGEQQRRAAMAQIAEAEGFWERRRLEDWLEVAIDEVSAAIESEARPG